MVKLRFKDGSLSFESNRDSWCRVTLEVSDRSIVLGAERRRAVFDRLRYALTSELSGQPSGVIEGHPARWVISFAEEHCSIYAADDGEGRTLYVQDGRAQLVASIRLSPAEREDWSLIVDQQMSKENKTYM